LNNSRNVLGPVSIVVAGRGLLVDTHHGMVIGSMRMRLGRDRNGRQGE
jgi:hypothetical protein